MKRRARRSCLLIVAALVGCDGVGRALVDRERGAGEVHDCAWPASCPPLPRDPAPFVVAPHTLGTRSCMAADSCAATGGSPLSPGPLLDPSAPALCDLAWTLDGASTTPPHDDLTCTRLLVQAELGVERVTLANLTLRQSELIVLSDTPLELTLTNAQLLDAEIELRGPITLRVTEQTRLERVRVVSGTADAALQLVEAQASELLVSGRDGRFAGGVELTRSRLDGSTIVARSSVARTTSLQRVQVRVDELVAVELAGDNVTLEPTRATLSDLKLSNFVLQRCGEVLVTGSMLADAILHPCAEPLRLHGTHVARSQVAGSIEGKSAGFNDVSFGAEVETQVELWGGSVVASTLCAQVQRFALDSVDALTCISCEPLAERASTVLCASVPPELEPDAGAANAGANPSCVALDQLSACVPAASNEHPF